MVKNGNSDDLVFQVTDWAFYHEANDSEEDYTKYTIQMYGTTKDNKKVYVQVEDYTPYFFIEIPKAWKNNRISYFIGQLKKKVPEEFRHSLKAWDVVDRHKFYGFTNYKLFPFVRLIFHSFEGFRAYERVLNRKFYDNMLCRNGWKFRLYESNIEPMLRFMHIRKVNSCGWIKVPAKKYNNFPTKETPSYNDINVRTQWTSIHPVDDKSIVPLIIASFDIECTSGDGSFPQPNRDSDKVIQIGTTFNRYGNPECFYKHIITLDTCDPIEGVDVESYDTEAKVLLAWTKLIQRMNPDVLTGYNIFGFDYRYLEARSKKLGVYKRFSKLGRLKDTPSPFIEKVLASAALGDNSLYYYGMQGRVQIDLMKVIMREHSLTSYKLDNVASEFIKERIKGVKINEEGHTVIETGSVYGLEVGRYIKIYYNDGLSNNLYRDGEKFQIIDLDKGDITINGILDKEAAEVDKYKVFWCQAKDDVKPQEIFDLQKGSSADRARVAEYCIQDCVLCNKLLEKLQVLTNNIGMANVCHVPLSYIFLRGQGVKIFSLVAKKCREKNHLMPVVRKPYNNNNNNKPWMNKGGQSNNQAPEEKEEGYEGATVLPPEAGVHFQPIPVLDYASLYPRSMIHRNISHECLVVRDEYNNLPGYKYVDVIFYNNDGTPQTCRYAQPKDGKIGIVCEISQDLLDARAATRALQKNEKDPFMWGILEGLQIAHKVTCNSLYGQTGAPTSPIYKREIAASTTATGREMLMAAKLFSEEVFPQIVKPILEDDYDAYYEKIDELFDTNKCGGVEMFPGYPFNEQLIGPKSKYDSREDFVVKFYITIRELLNGTNIAPNCVYGDTDSVFVDFQITDKKTGEKLSDHNALAVSIKLGILCGDLINCILPYPHNLEYEKTFWPFIILTKKRYVGNLYFEDPNKFFQKSMGIVLKRRDNADIVKIVVGGIVDKLLNEGSAKNAVAFVRNELKKILSGKYPIEKFIVTKTLRSEYADRTRIVHAVLADRMSARDPGNKPQSNDRIPYVFVEIKGKADIQGDRVENPEYIIENDLKIDYLYYITNQIMKPSVQFLEHVVKNPKKIFDDYILREVNRRKGVKPMNYYFGENGINKGDKEFDIDTIEPIEQSAKFNKPNGKKKAKPSAKKSVNKKKPGFTIDI